MGMPPFTTYFPRYLRESWLQLGPVDHHVNVFTTVLLRSCWGVSSVQAWQGGWGQLRLQDVYAMGADGSS